MNPFTRRGFLASTSGAAILPSATFAPVPALRAQPVAAAHATLKPSIVTALKGDSIIHGVRVVGAPGI